MTSGYREDLDKAFVINGDDLRIALGEGTWSLTGVTQVADRHSGRLRYPGDVADVVLGDIGKPLDELGSRITVKQLADALDQLPLRILSDKGDRFGGTPADPEDVARNLHARLTLRQACSGNGEPDVAGAHICCEHAGAFGGRATTVGEAVTRALHIMSGLTAGHQQDAACEIAARVVKDPDRPVPPMGLEDILSAVTAIRDRVSPRVWELLVDLLAADRDDRREREDPLPF